MVLLRLWAVLVLIGGTLATGRAEEKALTLPAVQEVKAGTPASRRSIEVAAEVHRLREAKDLIGLENLAADLRKSGEKRDDGTWLLGEFYREVTQVREEDVESASSVVFCREWVRTRPGSITARVSLAGALDRNAWKAPETKEARERFQEAWGVLEQARDLPEKCPAWYSVALSVGNGLDWERAVYEKLLDEAIQTTPSYAQYYSLAYSWMRGTDGLGMKGYEKWIAKVADAYPPAERNRHYANYVWLMDRKGGPVMLVFGPGRLDWGRVKDGFLGWLKDAPDNLAVRSEFTRLAVIAGDRETAREQFGILDGKLLKPYWASRDVYENARHFAFGGGPNPLATVGAASRPASPEVIAYTKLGVRLLAGFLGGVLAGTCLLIIGCRRDEVWAGVIALAACLILGTAFGTILTLVPAVGLWLYLRRRPVLSVEAVGPARWWVVLLWVLLLGAVYLGLQFAAIIFHMIPLVIAHPELGRPETGSGLVDALMVDRASYVIMICAAWIALLTLFAICPPQSREGWRRSLGLTASPLLSTIGWLLVAGVLLGLASWASELVMDAKSRDAIRIMLLGLAVPVPFLLAVVLVAPVVEEVIFRGYAYTAWVGRMGFWGASLLSSAIFALMHIQYGVAALGYVFVLGMVLCGLRWKTGSLYPCIALHVLNNLGSVIIGHYCGGH